MKNSTGAQEGIEVRYRSMLILWIGQMLSIGVFFLLTQFVAVSDDRAPNNLLSFVIAAVGTFIAIISFAVKGKLLQKSVENQDLALVQQASVVACALCEVPALLGVAERFILPGREYLLMFFLSAVTMALHFPRKLNLLAASYKDPSFGGAP